MTPSIFPALLLRTDEEKLIGISSPSLVIYDVSTSLTSSRSFILRIDPGSIFFYGLTDKFILPVLQQI